jgi:hypothetical protein
MPLSEADNFYWSAATEIFHLDESKRRMDKI